MDGPGSAGGGAERPLHEDGVEPAVELVADALEPADFSEAEPGMERKRLPDLTRDDRDDLARAGRRGFGQEGRQERAADAAPNRERRDVDRVLDGEAIGRPRPPARAVGIAHDLVSD